MADGFNNHEAQRPFGRDVLRDVIEPALLVDVEDPALPVIAVSEGFVRRSGRSAAESVLGTSIAEALVRDAPDFAVSKSGIKNTTSFASMCALPGVGHVGSTTVLQPAARADGAMVMVLSLLSRCVAEGRHSLLVVQATLSDSLYGPRVTPEARVAATERLRAASQRVLADLGARATLPTAGGAEAEELESPAFAFYAKRLQEHSMLLSQAGSAMRREPDELQNGCLLFSDRPIARSEKGLEFAVRVDGTAPSFVGLPVLGFTRTRPEDTPDLHPQVTLGLARSALIGGDGKASCRDQSQHFKVGFRPPPQEEVQTWTPPLSERLVGSREEPLIEPGDVLRCVYSHAGVMEFWRNQDLVLHFDVGRPLVAGEDYYAVVDVCFTASAVSVVPPARGGAERTAPPRRCAALAASVAAGAKASFPTLDLSDTSTADNLEAISDTDSDESEDCDWHLAQALSPLTSSGRGSSCAFKAGGPGLLAPASQRSESATAVSFAEASMVSWPPPRSSAARAGLTSAMSALTVASLCATIFFLRRPQTAVP